MRPPVVGLVALLLTLALAACDDSDTVDGCNDAPYVLVGEHEHLDALDGYSCMSGSLHIMWRNEPEEFALPDLTDVGGSLTIGQDGLTTTLPDLEGLSSLRSVGGGLTIKHSGSLNNLDGLRGLESIGTSSDSAGLSIVGNDLLSNISALPPLQSAIPFDLYIVDNPLLEDLAPLRDLRTVSRLQVSGMPLLTDLDDLSGITSLGADLLIYDNTALTSLDGLSSISGPLARSLIIGENPLITDLDGLSGITGPVGGVVRIEGNAALTDMTGLAGITFSTDGFAGHLRVANNPEIVDLTGLDGITSVDDLEIVGNASLISLAGLQNLASVEDDLIITGNPSLPDCAVCELLDQLGGDIHPDVVEDNLSDDCSPVPWGCPGWDS